MRNAEIVERFKQGDSRGHLSFLYQISASTVSRILVAAGISAEWMAERDEDDVFVAPNPGETECGKGHCLTCKRGTITHPDWPNGICPTCGGTGKYPKSIMEPRNKYRCPICGNEHMGMIQAGRPPRRCQKCGKRVELEVVKCN